MAVEKKFDEIIKRIQDVTGKKGKGEICEEMGTTTVSLNARRNKDDFDANWAFKIAQKYNLSTDWIMTGCEPKNINSTEPMEKTEKIKYIYLIRIEKWLNAIIASDPRNKDWFERHFEISFPQFGIWWNEKESEDNKGEFVRSRDAETVA